MRRFYAPIENFTDDVVHLDVDETRHLRDVLRLGKGDEIQVFDGEGREFLCRIESIEKKGTLLHVTKEVEPTAPESSLDLTLAAAITKGEKFDLIVQKAVELGVSRIAPVVTRRCDIKAGGGEKRMARWRKIALEASKQSGRARLMAIDDPVDLQQLAGERGTIGTTILFSERGGGSLENVKASGKVTAIVGPEGGWDDSELELAAKHGISVVTLGGRIMRAETAAITFAALLQHRFGDLR